METTEKRKHTTGAAEMVLLLQNCVNNHTKFNWENPHCSMTESYGRIAVGVNSHTETSNFGEIVYTLNYFITFNQLWLLLLWQN